MISRGLTGYHTLATVAYIRHHTARSLTIIIIARNNCFTTHLSDCAALCFEIRCTMLPAHHFVYGIVILANSVQGFRPPHPCFAFPTKVSKLRACSTASAFCSNYLGADASFTRTSNVKTTIGTPTVLVTTTEVVESTAVTGTISTSTTTSVQFQFLTYPCV